MISYRHSYLKTALLRSLLKGDLATAKTSFVNLRKPLRVWMKWNIPIIAGECLSFIPINLDVDWSSIATIACAKKSRSAYALSKLFYLGVNTPIVADFRTYVSKGLVDNDLSKHVMGKPVSSFVSTLAFAVEFLDPIVRFRSVDYKGIAEIPIISKLPWWAYPMDSDERDVIRATTFHQISYKTRLSRMDFNKIYDFVEGEDTPDEFHVDYEGLWGYYKHVSLGDFSDFDFTIIHDTAQWVSERVSQFFMDQEMRRGYTKYTMRDEQWI